MPGSNADDGPVSKTNIGRLTNAIFVFTLFLLFRNIRTPGYTDWLANITANEYGQMQFSEILSFLNAFLIIVMIWVIMFHIFHQYRKMDRVYMYLHIALMMTVIFIPVTIQHTLLFAEDPTVSIFFHMNMFAVGIVIALEWFHCIRNPELVRCDIPASHLFATNVSVLFIPLTAIAGFLLACANLHDTQYIYFVTIIAFAITDTALTRPLGSLFRRGI